LAIVAPQVSVIPAPGSTAAAPGAAAGLRLDIADLSAMTFLNAARIAAAERSTLIPEFASGLSRRLQSLRAEVDHARTRRRFQRAARDAVAVLGAFAGQQPVRFGPAEVDEPKDDVGSDHHPGLEVKPRLGTNA
jgi:hypothetical protein